MTPRILRSMNNLHKERLEQFIGEEWEWGRKIKRCKTVQNNELYKECSPATPIYAFFKA